jgi:ribosomal protein S27E
MQFTCDRCHGDYQATSTNAAAHLFLKDSRCNHIEARCSNCGNKEVIFLGPKQISTVISTEGVTATVEPEAGAALRVRAENAWAAAEELAARSEPASPTTPAVHALPTASDVLQCYELTQRHEELLDTFGDTLTNIPDGLLWDELRGDHDRKHPDRWID